MDFLVQAARQRRRSLPLSNGNQGDGTAATAADQLASSGGGGKATAGKKNWLRHRLFNMSKGSLKEDDDSDATSRASSAADLQVTQTCLCMQDSSVHNIATSEAMYRS